jgi:hypothetical protein
LTDDDGGVSSGSWRLRDSQDTAGTSISFAIGPRK